MTDRPRLNVTSVTIGAPDPRSLAQFYAQLLGVEVSTSDPPGPGEPPEAGWAQLRQDEPRLTLNFEYEVGYVAPTWPSEPGAPQIQEHLDIYVDDLGAATAWAISVGARLASYQPQDNVRVLLDPAGHPFCLFSE